jgi:hypothetical protein
MEASAEIHQGTSAAARQSLRVPQTDRKMKSISSLVARVIVAEETQRVRSFINQFSLKEISPELRDCDCFSSQGSGPRVKQRRKPAWKSRPPRANTRGQGDQNYLGHDGQEGDGDGQCNKGVQSLRRWVGSARFSLVSPPTKSSTRKYPRATSENEREAQGHLDVGCKQSVWEYLRQSSSFG